VSIPSPEASTKTESKGHADRRYWLGLSLLSVSFIAFAAFAEGFRLPGWFFCKPAVVWAVYPLQLFLLCLLAIQLISSPSRGLLSAWCVLLGFSLALCLGGYRVIDRLGRSLVQWEVSPSDLAKDCRRLIEEEGGAATDESTPSNSRPLAPEKWPASVRRMRPMYVMVEQDRIRLELHGGFEHYGYTLARPAGQEAWALEWYDEGNIREILATLPATE
jgi:hypothetical protein